MACHCNSAHALSCKQPSYTHLVAAQILQLTDAADELCNVCLMCPVGVCVASLHLLQLLLHLCHQAVLCSYGLQTQHRATKLTAGLRHADGSLHLLLCCLLHTCKLSMLARLVLTVTAALCFKMPQHCADAI
jgi:hypothetical protein